MKRTQLVFAGLLVAASALGGAWFAAHPHRHTLVKATDQKGQTYWTCSMHPQVHLDHPGNCPICGMTLIEKPETPAAATPVASEAVQIDPRMMQNLAIRTAKVTRAELSGSVEVAGSVEVDERRIVAVESRAAGWVEQLAVRAAGESVQRGQRLAAIYAPDIYAAQQELVLAQHSGDAGLLAAARQRAALLGLSAQQIGAVLASGHAQRASEIPAPSSGVVLDLAVREGQQVMPGTPLMRIADLSKVWVTAEIPEALAGAASVGAPVQARFAGLGGRTWTGTLEFVYPRLDTGTRTLRARIAIDNPQLQLKPGMYARIALAGPGGAALVVPSEALIRSGRRDVVILAEGDGRFRPAAVRAGREAQGQTEILDGLREGEDIVVSGQFLIDSEASLRGVLARMNAPEAAP